jgi:hypothetical protein
LWATVDDACRRVRLRLPVLPAFPVFLMFSRVRACMLTAVQL